MKTKTIITTMLGMMLSLILVSAISTYSGQNYTFSVDTTDELIYDVVGNSSDMDGFNVYQDIYEDYSNITFSTDINFASDSFKIVLFSNITNEVIVEVEVPVHHYSSGGGGTRTIYRDRNITEYILLGEDCEEDVCDVDINDTDDIIILDEEPEKIGVLRRFWNWLKRVFGFGDEE